VAPANVELILISIISRKIIETASEQAKQIELKTFEALNLSQAGRHTVRQSIKQTVRQFENHTKPSHPTTAHFPKLTNDL